jgi:secondary thiamine-phosphate synthase enzyme
MHTIEIRTDRRRQMVDVTQKVQRALDELHAGDGLCLVWVPHTTAAVTVNENADPDVARDLVAAFEAMLPAVEFHHAEGNSDAHLLSTLIGASLTVPVEDGRLCLGTWQGLYFVELDGPRSRRLWVGFR